MSDRNDPCERCRRVSYYEGHTDWCNAIQELEDRVKELEDFIKILQDSDE